LFVNLKFWVFTCSIIPKFGQITPVFIFSALPISFIVTFSFDELVEQRELWLLCIQHVVRGNKGVRFLPEEERFVLGKHAFIHQLSGLSLSGFDFNFFQFWLINLTVLVAPEVMSVAAITVAHIAFHLWALVVHQHSPGRKVVIHVGIFHETSCNPEVLSIAWIDPFHVDLIQPTAAELCNLDSLRIEGLCIEAAVHLVGLLLTKLTLHCHLCVMVDSANLAWYIYKNAAPDYVFNQKLRLRETQLFVKLPEIDVSDTSLVYFKHTLASVELKGRVRVLVAPELVLSAFEDEAEDLHWGVHDLFGNKSELLSHQLICLSQHRVERLSLSHFHGVKSLGDPRHGQTHSLDGVFTQRCFLKKLVTIAPTFAKPLERWEGLVKNDG